MIKQPKDPMKKEADMTIAPVTLWLLRQLAGKTQIAIAKAARMSQNEISKLENHAGPTPIWFPTAERIGAELDVPPRILELRPVHALEAVAGNGEIAEPGFETNKFGVGLRDFARDVLAEIRTLRDEIERLRECVKAGLRELQPALVGQDHQSALELVAAGE